MAQQKSSSGGRWLVFVAILLVGYCSLKEDKPAATATTVEAVETSDDSSEEMPGAGPEGKDQTGEGPVIAGETYAEYDDRRDVTATGLYSSGYQCTEDCSGHDAGRQWAEQRGITNADDCGGRSWSFVEGCRSYADEQTSSSSTESDAEEVVY